jgi:hypothetical protein
VQRLSEADLERVRRGGWPIHRVITHVIEHDYYMAMFVASARAGSVLRAAAIPHVPVSPSTR